MKITTIISQISEEEKTPLVLTLIESLQLQSEEIQKLKDEIAILKKQNKRPKIKPSNLEGKKRKNKKHKKGKRPGSEKRCKTKELDIHETIPIAPDVIPKGSILKGYNDFVVQDIVFEPRNIKYRIERWQGPDGEYITGKLPEDVQGHFGQKLTCFILFQYYHSIVTQPLIYDQLHEIGIDISKGQISKIIIEGKEIFHQEKEEILKVGLEVSNYINVDDTGSRHNGKNGYCTHIGNECFAYFESSERKNRINFLKILRSCHTDYVVNIDAIAYMRENKLPNKVLCKISDNLNTVLENDQEWTVLLNELNITKSRHIQIATEGALVGSLMEHGFNTELVIMSDDAGQFNVFLHTLCWIHAERNINKLVGFNDEQRKDLEAKKKEIWDFYDALKQYKENPTVAEKNRLDNWFDDIFTIKTDFATLNKGLKQIYNNKSELLLVLRRPDIPLHNNLSENDIREYVKRRKISGSTRSPTGKKCRDTFTSLKKTCRKLGISFWNYLMDRIKREENTIPYLPDLVRLRAEEIFE